MKCKIQKKRQDHESLVVVEQRTNILRKLPRQLIFAIVAQVKFENRKNLRETCREMKDVVDYEQMQEFKKFLKQRPTCELLSFAHFATEDFHPPLLHRLIHLPAQISQDRINEFQPRASLLENFYIQARRHFDGGDLKLLFLQTMFDELKCLTDGMFTINTKGIEIKISFVISSLYFAILWSKMSFSNLIFGQHFPGVLVGIARMIDIKKSFPVNITAPIYRNEIMDFGTILMMVGSKVNANIKWDVKLRGDSQTIQAIAEFVKNGKLDWEKVEEVQGSIIVTNNCREINNRELNIEQSKKNNEKCIFCLQL